jgi:hypothetical protein
MATETIAVGDPQDQRIERRHMDMPLRDDNPVESSARQKG